MKHSRPRAQIAAQGRAKQEEKEKVESADHRKLIIRGKRPVGPSDARRKEHLGTFEREQILSCNNFSGRDRRANDGTDAHGCVYRREPASNIETCDDAPTEQERQQEVVQQEACRAEKIRRFTKRGACDRNKSHASEPGPAKRRWDGDKLAGFDQTHAEIGEEDNHSFLGHDGAFPGKHDQ